MRAEDSPVGQGVTGQGGREAGRRGERAAPATLPRPARSEPDAAGDALGHEEEQAAVAVGQGPQRIVVAAFLGGGEGGPDRGVPPPPGIAGDVAGRGGVAGEPGRRSQDETCAVDGVQGRAPRHLEIGGGHPSNRRATPTKPVTG